ncbi:MAG TPA: tetratricopeptide repeat protein [Candidatus Eremiobacteraceae bacterium]|nr:tetratricopeptide repeat protein [Candidatus Eremiobacteraceae bacterium]
MNERASVTAAPLVAEGDSLAAARRYQEAAERYAAALRLEPENQTLAKQALGTFWRAAKFDDAYLWGQRALQREPESLDVLFDLGVTYGYLVDLANAEAIFQRSVAVDPSFVEGHGELGFIAEARGDQRAAIRHMETAYEIAPENDFAVSGLAQILIPAGQAARAIKLMDPRLKANRRARAYGGRSMLTLYGWALLQLGETARANAIFAEVLEWLHERERAGETTYQLYRERAAIHAMRGERDAALAAMQTALERGWRLYASWSLIDGMFDSVREDPAVGVLVERMREDARAIRRRIGLPEIEPR